MVKTTCPRCQGFAADTRTASFTIAGVTHTVPGIWLAGRSREYKVGLAGYAQACADWADQCAMALQFEAEHAA